jgi:molybdopterin molybdotransferase
MQEFLTLVPPVEALQRFLQAFPVGTLNSETVETRSALGRVTALPILAPHPLPSFPRSTVDGYAVRAADTYGASENLPVYLQLVGEVRMGVGTNLVLAPSQCALIHTGGMLPVGADAVVMVEYTQSSRSEEIELMRSVALGENILQIGEDVSKGEEVISTGIRIGPAEIGGLMALGLTQLTVVCPPRVGIISSGDEIVSPGEVLQPGQVRDVNAYTLGALVARSGGKTVSYGIFADQVEALHTVSARALTECDMVVITAGSSASTRDITAQVINALGSPGVLVHGVNIRPGKPTILAVCNGKPVIGLPGNPVSALVIAELFVVPVIEALLQLRGVEELPRRLPYPSIRAKLTVNIPSQAGREDWIPVKLIQSTDGCYAEPLFGKSNLIFTLVRADGMVCIPPDVTGLSAGELVDILWL